MSIKNKLYKTIFFLLICFTVFASYPSLGDEMNLEENTLDIPNTIENALTLETSNNVTDEDLNLNSRSCVVIDRLSKKILYGKNENNKVKMASTTKIMTAIVVLENSSLNKTVEVSKKAAGTGGSRLGLKTGDKITICDLLYGLLLCSGNDAAVCLAESVAGSVPQFSDLMNAKAKELGLVNSHFESPHGLDSEGHYTTAYELAILSDYALKNPTFYNIVGTKNYTVTINGYSKNLSNTNELLGNLNGVYGIKTGFTNGANRCLVTACKRDKMDIICVVLGADTKNFRTKDSIKLIEYAFKTYEYFNIQDFVNKYLIDWQNNNSDFFMIEKGTSNNLLIKIDDSISQIPVIPVKKELISSMEASLTVNPYLIAPIQQNDELGILQISSQGIDIASFNVLASTDIQKNNLWNYMFDFFKNYPLQLENSIF